jgi:hypothetical protein
MTILVVLYFRRRADNHRLHVAKIEPELFVSNRKHIYAV